MQDFDSADHKDSPTTVRLAPTSTRQRQLPATDKSKSQLLSALSGDHTVTETDHTVLPDDAVLSEKLSRVHLLNTGTGVQTSPGNTTLGNIMHR